MRKSSKNVVILGIIEDIIKRSHKNNSKMWREMARRLSRSASRSAEVNISRIARYTAESDVVAVPGKVLSSGVINHKVTVAAYAFSKKAREKIMNSGGECLSLTELADRIPDGKGIRIME
ncbi:MAG TPA: 50S ribosomal protein L18e [Euryarchaeota archaeon]|nr:50S ribosomal protein L18e [archaeon BMS3Bbin15]HDL14617.1 50S ribosomal protein L18e [Euryarchaeota archaeon]